jgi:hypothetical protein
VDKRYKNAVAGMGIRKIVACKNKGHFQKMGLYIFKYKNKWETLVRNNETERDIY